MLHARRCHDELWNGDPNPTFLYQEFWRQR
jgi:hypothetical protein